MSDSAHVSEAAQDEVPLAQPVLGEAEEDAVTRVLRSGRLSLGPLLGAFEERFAAFVGAPLASAVSSGTAGLHLALRAAGVRDGDEVITSPFSFVASANAIVYERARPVFVDIDPRTLTIDPAAAAAAVTERTRALLPVHIFGWPADVRRARAPGPADRRGRLRGARGALRRRRGGRRARSPGGLRLLREQADDDRRGRDGHARGRGPQGAHRQRAKPGPRPDMDWLDHDRLGFNYRLSEIACAIGLAQLERLEGLLAERARVAAAYAEALAGIEGLELLCPDEPGGAVRGWFVYTSASRAAATATRRSARCASSASRASPTCRRST